MVQRAGVARPQHLRHFMGADRREHQPIRRRRQAGGIGDRRHLDRRFRAVKKRIEHLRVHSADPGLLRRQAVVAPDGFGRGGMIFRHVLGALAGGDHREAAGPRPVHQFADQRRLVAIGQAVDHAGGLGFARQQRAGEHVGLHIHHDDVLALANRATGMGDAGRGVAGGFDHDLDLREGDHRRGVIDEAGGGDAFLGPADISARLAGAVGRQVGDGGDLQARRRRHLRQEHRTELAGADQPDAHRMSSGGAPLQQAIKVHVGPPVRIAARFYRRPAENANRVRRLPVEPAYDPVRQIPRPAARAAASTSRRSAASA